MKKHLRVGIIGPTNMGKLIRLTRKSSNFFLEKAEIIGKVIAGLGHELWVNSDGGMVRRVARSYQRHGGKRLVVLYPKKGEPWPNTHASMYVGHADKVSEQKNWFWQIMALSPFLMSASVLG